MARILSRPARNALSRTVGIGNCPVAASSVATMRPSVAAGTIASATAQPRYGTSERNEAPAAYMKNRLASASGRLKKVRMPSLTHWMPVRAGTMLSFIGKYEGTVALDAVLLRGVGKAGADA